MKTESSCIMFINSSKLLINVKGVLGFWGGAEVSEDKLQEAKS